MEFPLQLDHYPDPLRRFMPVFRHSWGRPKRFRSFRTRAGSGADAANGTGAGKASLSAADRLDDRKAVSVRHTVRSPSGLVVRRRSADQGRADNGASHSGLANKT